MKVVSKLAQLALPRTGRVHTHYAQAVAVTGRLSSNDPNLQNIPVKTAEGRRVREAFVAPAGSVIASADYSQIELRIMAHISEDAALLRAFTDGLDVHRATASEVFGLAVDQVNSALAGIQTAAQQSEKAARQTQETSNTLVALAKNLQSLVQARA